LSTPAKPTNQPSGIPGAFPEGKFYQHFASFDPSSAQHREGVRRLERSLRAKCPELLSYLAYWKQGWDAKPGQAEDPDQSVDQQKKITKVLVQHHSDSCGATSLAMVINALENRHIDDNWLLEKYPHISLLGAGQAELPHWTWRDAGDLVRDTWSSIYDCLAVGGLGIIGLNGPEFSPSGYGHILVIYKLTRTMVGLVDPALGTFREVSRSLVESCPPHNDGKFVFLATPRK